MSVTARFERRVRAIPVDTAAGRAVVRVGTLRASAGWRSRPSTVMFATGMSLPLGVEAGGTSRRVWSPGRRGLGLARVLFAGAADQNEEEPTMETGEEKVEYLHRPAGYAAEQIGQALVTAASGAGAVGPATTVGDRTVIPLTETMFSGGFGTGGGTGIDSSGQTGGGSGGGGGGGGRSRTVALAVIGPDGVEVHPVIDATGLALAALTTVAGLATRVLFRGRRKR